MTEAERDSIRESVMLAREQLNLFELLAYEADLESLYQAAKPVHEAALGIWSAICEILRAQKALEPKSLQRETSDAINLDELFKTENACGN